MLNAHWDDRPDAYAQTRECWLTRRRVRFLSRFLRNLPDGARILEIGSGAGEVLIALSIEHPRLTFVGLEPQASYVDFATRAAGRRKLRNCSFRVGSAEAAGEAFAADLPFDLVLSNDVLHHIARTELAAASVARVTRPGARWLAIAPHGRHLDGRGRGSWRRGEANFGPAPFLKIARRAGWTGERRSFLFLIPPFIKSPSWLLVRLEGWLEELPVVAGGVALEMERELSP